MSRQPELPRPTDVEREGGGAFHFAADLLRTYAFAISGHNLRFPPKADMCSATGDVRFVPIADIRRCLRYIPRCGAASSNF